MIYISLKAVTEQNMNIENILRTLVVSDQSQEDETFVPLP